MADNFAQTVKDQVDIVKIIGDYVKLRKTGAQNLPGLCPFHKEKTGSFSVNATHGYFYCFGCHEKGDVFTFVMKMDALTFPEAVRVVAAKAGIPLPKREFSSPEEARDAGLRKQLVDLHEGATQYFEAQLKSPFAARAREYLTGRGVYAGNHREVPHRLRARRLQRHARPPAAALPDEVMRASGLFTSSEKSGRRRADRPALRQVSQAHHLSHRERGGQADRVHRARARRQVDDKGEDVAKYMNSPETPLYTKGQRAVQPRQGEGRHALARFRAAGRRADGLHLGLHGRRQERARDQRHRVYRGAGPPARPLHQARGRQLRPGHGGRRAAEKSIALLTEEGFEVKVVTLEGGLDPDRFVRENGIQAYMAALRTAKRHSDYLIERARSCFPAAPPDAKVKAMNFLLPHIRRSPSAIFRAEFTDDAIQKLQIDSATFREELKKAAAQRLQSVPQRRTEPASERERVLLRALVLPESDPAREHAAIELQQHPEWLEGLPAGPLLESLANAPVPQNPLDAAPDDASRTMLAEVLATQVDPEARANEQSSRAEEQPMTEQVANALLSLHERQLKKRQEELRTGIAEAERRGDTALVDRLTAENMAVNKMLREL